MSLHYRLVRLVIPLVSIFIFCLLFVWTGQIESTGASADAIARMRALGDGVVALLIVLNALLITPTVSTESLRDSIFDLLAAALCLLGALGFASVTIYLSGVPTEMLWRLLLAAAYCLALYGLWAFYRWLIVRRREARI